MSLGHRASACAALMFDWLARSGSLKPSRTRPSPLACAKGRLVLGSARASTRPYLGSELRQEVRDPLRRRLEAAERVEVQLDLAVLGRVEAGLQVEIGRAH